MCVVHGPSTFCGSSGGLCKFKTYKSITQCCLAGLGGTRVGWLDKQPRVQVCVCICACVCVCACACVLVLPKGVHNNW